MRFIVNQMATQGYQPYSNEHHLHQSIHHGAYDQWNQGHSYYDHNAYAQAYGYGATYGSPYHQGQPYYDQAVAYQGGYYQTGLYPQYDNAYNEQNSFLPSDCSDCIYISGLPTSIKKDDLVTQFTQAGKIKITKGTNRVFLFLDRKTKEPIGSATITYQSSDSAKRAIDLFHNKNFNGDGTTMNVQIATPEQKNPFAEMLRRQSEANSVFSNSPMSMNGYHNGAMGGRTNNVGGGGHRGQMVNGQHGGGQQHQRPVNQRVNQHQHYRNSTPVNGRNMRNMHTNVVNGYKNHNYRGGLSQAPRQNNVTKVNGAVVKTAPNKSESNTTANGTSKAN